MKKLICILLTAAFIMTSFSGCGKDTETNTTKNSGEIIDNNSVAISDFYQYVNEEWISNTELKEGEYLISATQATEDIVNERIFDYIESLNKETLNHSSGEYKLKVFYDELKNIEKRNQTGIEPAKYYISKIEAVTNLEELYSLYEDSELSLFNRLIYCDVTPNTGSGKYDIQVTADDLYSVQVSLNEIQNNKLMNQIKKELLLFGYNEEMAATMAENAANINTEIANYYGTAHDNWQFMAKSGLDKIVKNIPLSEILTSLGYFENRDTIYTNYDYLDILSSLHTSDNLEALKDFYIVSVIHSLANVLNEELLDIYEETKSLMLGTEYIKDKMVDIKFIKKYFNSFVAEYYNKTFISDELVNELELMANDIISVFSTNIDSNEWMSDSTKEKAKLKLDNLKIYIGRNGRYNDYSSLVLSGENLSQDYIAILKNNIQFDKNLLCEEMDRDKLCFDMLAVNAYYSPGTNSIIICSGWLSNELVDDNSSYEEILGITGYIMAHEISHAFDTSGSYYDEYGKSDSWMKEADFTKYMQRVNKIKNFFNGKKTAEGISINGDYIKDETFADLTAVTCCLGILDNMENADYDLFFKSYAMLYRQKATTEFNKFLAMTDVHLPADFRVNYILTQFDKFYETYNIDKNSDIYVNTEDRLKVY